MRACTCNHLACEACRVRRSLERKLAARPAAPSFTHEELLAMWHTLSPADGAWKELGAAVAKLDAYESECRRLSKR